MAAGAVKVAVVAVALLMVPHPPAALLRQLTDQVTPEFVVSLLTFAVSAAVPLVTSVVGTPLSATEISIILIVAEGDASGAVTDVAITVTVWPIGTVAGAVYVTVFLVVLLKVPQAPATLLPQVTDQVTPAFAGSFVTVAVSGTGTSIESEAGAPERLTVIALSVVVVALTGEPPHETSPGIAANAASKRTDCRSLIARPRSFQAEARFCLSRSARHEDGLRIHADCEW